MYNISTDFHHFTKYNSRPLNSFQHSGQKNWTSFMDVPQAWRNLNGLNFSHRLVFPLLKNGSPLKITLKRFGIFAWKMAVLNHCVDLHELHELIYILAKITPRPPFMLIQKRCGNWVVYIPQFYFMQICFYVIFQLASKYMN